MNMETTKLQMRKVQPGHVQLLRGNEVLGSVQAVTTSGRPTGKWIICIGADGRNASWGRRYASARLAMNALAKKAHKEKSP